MEDVAGQDALASHADEESVGGALVSHVHELELNIRRGTFVDESHPDLRAGGVDDPIAQRPGMSPSQGILGHHVLVGGTAAEPLAHEGAYQPAARDGGLADVAEPLAAADVSVRGALRELRAEHGEPVSSEPAAEAHGLGVQGDGPPLCARRRVGAWKSSRCLHPREGDGRRRPQER